MFTVPLFSQKSDHLVCQPSYLPSRPGWFGVVKGGDTHPAQMLPRLFQTNPHIDIIPGGPLPVYRKKSFQMVGRFVEIVPMPVSSRQVMDKPVLSVTRAASRARISAPSASGIR
jgi:hypothetical protein